MKKLYWNIIGSGNINLILLHGIGFNSKIWIYIINILKNDFTIYLIDLPGYGKNKHLYNISNQKLIKLLFLYIPKNSIWLGWSIGGLIVMQAALLNPNNILGIITVSSSPYFIYQKQWPGIKKQYLKIFYQNFKKNFYQSINNFLDLQILDKQKYSRELTEIKKKYLLKLNLVYIH